MRFTRSKTLLTRSKSRLTRSRSKLSRSRKPLTRSKNRLTCSKSRLTRSRNGFTRSKNRLLRSKNRLTRSRSRLTRSGSGEKLSVIRYPPRRIRPLANQLSVGSHSEVHGRVWRHLDPPNLTGNRLRHLALPSRPTCESVRRPDGHNREGDRRLRPIQKLPQRGRRRSSRLSFGSSAKISAALTTGTLNREAINFNSLSLIPSNWREVRRGYRIARSVCPGRSISLTVLMTAKHKKPTARSQ
jgi:hypothetical protein